MRHPGGRDALQTSEEGFRLLVESVRDYAIFMLDPEGHVTTWNRGAERMKGYAAHEIIGQHFSRFYPLEDIRAGKPARELEAAAAEGRREDEGWRVRKDGSLFWADVVITALRNDAGRLVGFAKVTRDLTERKRAEEERIAMLARERAARAEVAAANRLAFLAEASRLLAGSLDYEATLQRIAQLAVPTLADCCALDVVAADGTLGRLAIAHVDPAKAELAWDLSRRYTPQPRDTTGPAAVVRDGRPELDRAVPGAPLVTIGGEGEHLRVLRELGLRSYLCVPLLAHGRTLGALTLARADQLAYGPADLELAQDLARRAAVAIENGRLFREAQDAVRTRDEFLAIASHELKTPLTPLQLQVQALLGMVRKGTLVDLPPERLSGMLEVSERQIKRLTLLVNELLDVSRITGGRLALEPEDVDLAELTQGVVSRLQPELARSGSTVAIALDGQVVGRWDRLRVEQVVTNLLSNAIKYGPGQPIEVRLSRDGATARLTVRDHGIGIAPEDRARIFERFERAVSLRHYGGLGLGLYITRQIVEAHGGTVHAESEGSGCGSTFVVHLPVPGPEGHAA